MCESGGYIGGTKSGYSLDTLGELACLLTVDVVRENSGVAKTFQPESMKAGGGRTVEKPQQSQTSSFPTSPIHAELGKHDI